MNTILPSVYHSSPVKLHLGLTGYSWTKWLARRQKVVDAPAPPPHPPGPVYDSVFVLSSGRVTSIGPKGEFNWQVYVISLLLNLLPAFIYVSYRFRPVLLGRGSTVKGYVYYSTFLPQSLLTDFLLCCVGFRGLHL